MRIEHFAYQVADPKAVAEWYVANLGFSVKRQMDTPPYMTFLADEGDQVMIEIYYNDAAPLPNYANQDPLIVHLALVSDDPGADKARLMAAGATIAADTTVTPAGDTLVMLRDPWGFCIQLCQRKDPMI